MRAALALLAVVSAVGMVPTMRAFAQAPTKIALRYQRDDERKPPFVQLPLVRRKVADGCALNVGGALLGPTLGMAGSAMIAGKAYKEREICDLQVDCEAARIPYAVRVVKGEWEAPCLMCACAMVGDLGGAKVAFLDATMNGRYDDYGKDLMAIGGVPYAYPLSRLVVAGGKGFEIELSADGGTLMATPCREEWETLDFVSKLGGTLRPTVVVLAREVPGGKDFAALYGTRPGKLPRGRWRLAYAVVGDDIWVEGDPAAEPVNLTAKPGVLAWGAPYSLAPEVVVAQEGRVRTFTAPDRLKAPRLDEDVKQGVFVVLPHPPPVLGSAGEKYHGPWTRQDRMGNSLADPGVKSFSVDVVQNGRIANLGYTSWAPWDLSGLVEKIPPYWLSHDIPASGYPGPATVTVAASSPLFGTLRSKPIAIDISR